MAEIAEVVEDTEKALIDGLSDLGKDSDAFKSAEQAIKDSFKDVKNLDDLKSSLKNLKNMDEIPEAAKKLTPEDLKNIKSNDAIDALESEGYINSEEADLAKEANDIEGGGDGGGGDDQGESDQGDTGKENALKKAAKACWNNKKTCAALGGLAGLGTYIGVRYASLSDDQKTCMLQCLPTNWDQKDKASNLNYQKAQLGPDNETINPRCVCPDSECGNNKACSCPSKGQNCETFCKAECVKKYNPDDPFNYLPGGKGLEKLFGQIGSIAKWAILIVIYLIIACILFVIIRFLYNAANSS